jgi:SpoIVB peptidase S55
MHMTKRTGLVAVVLFALWWTSLPAVTEFMPIDEIKPGLVGVGRTVFEGAKIEEFQVHILGVIRNVIGPRRDLILARLEGGPLATTGVIAGMSGSPVYIDGRLVGAVSYSLGQFSREPIAGITPIQEMIDATSIDSKRAPIGQRARLEVPMTHESIARALRTAFSWAQPFAEQGTDTQLFGGAELGPLGSQIGSMLRPIATPLSLGGFTPQVAGELGTMFGGTGLMPVVGAAGGGAGVDEHAALQPGDAVGVQLINGDLSVGATGTVTLVDGLRVYAFGHPFYNLGPTQFPMTRAYVHTLLPSLSSSAKLASTGETIGTVQQDRATAIAGLLGKGPDMIPVKIALENDRGLKKAFSFGIVNDQLFGPLLTYVSVINTLTSYERENGTASYTVKGKALVKEHGEIAFEDLFTGDRPSVGAAAYVAAPITFLLTNDDERVEIEGLDLSITSTEQPLTATLERVWVDGARVRAGHTTPIKVLLRTYRGEEVVRTVPIEIPPNVSGPMSVLISDGTRLTQFEQREMRRPAQPRGVTQMIRALNRARKNNRLYVRLLSSEAGAVINGEYLSSLPPSVLAVVEGDRNGGDFTPLRNATLGEWELPTDYAVIGSRLLTIDVDN